MVAIIRSLRFASKRLPATSFIAAPVQRSSFHFTALRAAGKESALHQEGRAEEAEHHKQEQLKKQEQGKGQWVDELASDSESAIKADRGEGGEKMGTDDISKLQEQTKHAASKKHN